MAGNSFGLLYRVTTFGESHGGVVGCVIDGCPPLLEISTADIQKELDRRKPGQSKITTQRKEEDQIEALSGVFEGKTTGTPILLIAKNKNARPQDYVNLKNIYRPSHADYTYESKYGIRDYCGGGRASARETLARVAAGAVAKKYLKIKFNIEILSFVEQIGSVKTHISDSLVTVNKIESNLVRCPDKKVAQKMIKLIEVIKNQGDSIGGIIKTIVKNMPVGLGEPVFDKLSADLGKAILSINAAKGFEIGAGFSGVVKKGSKQNDRFIVKNNQIKTLTNNSGGIQGGISNGENLIFRTVFKPTATIKQSQLTVTNKKKKTIMQSAGRHDPCVLPRAVPIVDAMTAITLMDHYLRHKAQNL